MVFKIGKISMTIFSTRGAWHSETKWREFKIVSFVNYFLMMLFSTRVLGIVNQNGGKYRNLEVLLIIFSVSRSTRRSVNKVFLEQV